jgi:SAM-dependent methyltransferase
VANNDPAPNPHATEEEVEAARSDLKLANVLYHDWEAGTYDEKWSISYDERCIDYATGRFRAACGANNRHGRAVAGDQDWPYEHAMELGSGTGFFLLNLMQGGVIKKGSVTDLSPGMVEVALRNAENLGLDVDGRVADAETIPYEDNSFDLVVGHAVLHHIPDVPTAFREVLRVLKPGGRFVFAGEPTKIGDTYARKLGQFTWWLTTNARRRNWTSPPAPPRWKRSSTSTRSTRRTWSGWRARPVPRTCTRTPRSWRPRCSAGRCVPSRPPCRRRS